MSESVSFENKAFYNDSIAPKIHLTCPDPTNQQPCCIN